MKEYAKTVLSFSSFPLSSFLDYSNDHTRMKYPINLYIIVT